MITFSSVKKRHVISMNDRDLEYFAELIFLLKHSPPPAGYNRKPFTPSQMRVVEELYELIPYPDGYGNMLNAKTGQ